MSSFYRIFRAARRTRLLDFLIAATLWTLPLSLFASPDRRPVTAESVLDLYLKAHNRVNLRGRMTVISSSSHGPTRTVRKRVVRTADGRSLAEVLEPAEERGTQTMDDGKWIYSYDPVQNQVKVKRSHTVKRDARMIARQTRLILRNYRVILEGRERFADRICYRLRCVPRDPINHTLHLWVDTQTGVELCRQENDRRGNTLNVSFFNSIEYPARIAPQEVKARFPANALQINISRSAIYPDIASLRRVSAYDISAPLWMPEGYELENCAMMMVDGQNRATLRYTNGLSVITICQAPPAQRRPPGYSIANVLTLPYGEVMVDYATQNRDYMVVGRCDPQGLSGIVHGLNAEQEADWRARLAEAFRASNGLLSQMRSRGMGLDTIAALLAISQSARQKQETLYSLYMDGWDWRYLARRFRVNEEQVAFQIRPFQRR
jgi:negative regulator of sigma E activity